tara:strand:+ start:697 stop:2043 length:1347 start_codon:yes stop_codon:yes gene_type:complete
MKKFYITTAIPYVNGPPHIGHALEFIQADVVARYNRLLKKDVFFLTGADEHGSKIVQTAKDQKIGIKKLVDKNTKTFIDLHKALNISYDNFIRTSDQKKHWPVAQVFWKKLVEKGDIYKDKYRGLYCVGCEAFVAKKDLINGKCPEHNKKPELLQEENYFFKLSKYIPEIKAKIKKQELKIIPKERENEILSLLEQGTGDVSFSRPKKVLPWGIPVPEDDSHVIYVWCDALINYLSGDTKNFWPADVHVIGKGILRFHAAIWPGMLLAVGLPLPKTILVHGYITSNGQKMSKSLGNVIDPSNLIKKHGTDAARYYLLREIPTTSDGDFSWERFEQRYNADLANDLGNLIKRSENLIKDIKIKNQEFKINPEIENFKFDKALDVIWKKIKWANQFIDKNKLWENKDKKKLAELKTAIYEIGLSLQPFIPETAQKILKGDTDKPLFPRIK